MRVISPLNRILLSIIGLNPKDHVPKVTPLLRNPCSILRIYDWSYLNLFHLYKTLDLRTKHFPFWAKSTTLFKRMFALTPRHVPRMMNILIFLFINTNFPFSAVHNRKQLKTLFRKDAGTKLKTAALAYPNRAVEISGPVRGNIRHAQYNTPCVMYSDAQIANTLIRYRDSHLKEL